TSEKNGRGNRGFRDLAEFFVAVGPKVHFEIEIEAAPVEMAVVEFARGKRSFVEAIVGQTACDREGILHPRRYPCILRCRHGLGDEAVIPLEPALGGQLDLRAVCWCN